MQYIWNTFIYEPIYNSLIFISHTLFNDVGLAVIVLTVLIRLILMPLSRKSIISQYKMKAIQPKIDLLKSQKLDKQEEAQKLMEIYKEEKINPFSGCLFIIIQLPILIALYLVFSRGIYQPGNLYSFLTIENLKVVMLGIVDITKPFLPFAILAGVFQGIQAFLAPTPQTNSDEKGFQAQFAKSMSVQTRYILPLIIIFIASRLSAAVSLYWMVTNVFSILQEIYFRKKHKLVTK